MAPKREADLLLVLGDGHTMPVDRDEFLSWGVPHDVGSLGRSIKEYPGKVHHWFNADGHMAYHWAKNLTNGNGTIKHTLGDYEGFDCDWEIQMPDYHYGDITGETNKMHGSSALFATLAGLELGYSKITLAGCPLDMGGHWYFKEKKQDTLGPIWLGCDFMAWIDFRDSPVAYRVKSMSGFTAKLLGQATRDWADGMLWVQKLLKT